MDYTNLRDKSIFDFTRDEKILKEVLSETLYFDYIEDSEETIKDSKHFLPRAKMGHILEFSKVVKNDELYEALKKEFEDEYPNAFRKVGDPLVSPYRL